MNILGAILARLFPSEGTHRFQGEAVRDQDGRVHLDIVQFNHATRRPHREPEVVDIADSSDEDGEAMDEGEAQHEGEEAAMQGAAEPPQGAAEPPQGAAEPPQGAAVVAADYLDADWDEGVSDDDRERQWDALLAYTAKVARKAEIHRIQEEQLEILRKDSNFAKWYAGECCGKNLNIIKTDHSISYLLEPPLDAPLHLFTMMSTKPETHANWCLRVGRFRNFSPKTIARLEERFWKSALEESMRIAVAGLAFANGTPPERIMRRLHHNAASDMVGWSEFEGEFLAVTLNS
jgi:hypothetical protein